MSERKREQCNFMLPVEIKELLRRCSFEWRIPQWVIVERAITKYLQKQIKQTERKG